MNGYLKQSTASQTRWIGPFVDDTDFKTAETALTIANTDIKVSKNGGASASKNSGGGTHDVNGMYAVTWDATDTATVGQLAYSVKVAGALQVFGFYTVLEEAVYDAWYAASAVGYTADQPVNVTKVNGTSQTARDLGAQLDAAVTTRLAPTTAGRTLDVSVTGEAGIDWANIGAPTTTVNLLATTIKNVTDVDATTSDISTRLPGALVGGRMDSSVGAMASGVLTAAAIAADAITAAKIADGALDRGAFAADTGLQPIRSNTAAAGGSSTIDLDASASSTADFYKGCIIYLTGGTGAGQARVIILYGGGVGKTCTVDRAWITNPDNTTTYAILPQPMVRMSDGLSVYQVDNLANNAITAGVIATDAIGSSELAASAITEIQSGLSTLDAAGVRTAVGLASANLDTQLAAIDDAVDTEVGAIKAVTDKLDTALELDGAVYRYTTNALEQAPTGGSAPTAADIADAVWDESLAAHLTAGSTGAGLNAAGSAGDPWSTALPGAYGAGTAGKIVGDNLNATVSSRSTLTAAQVNTEADTALADVGLTSTVTGRIDAAISSRLASGTVSADVTAIKAKTDNLPAAPAATGDIPSAATVASQVRTELTTELGRMDAAVSTRATPAQVNTEVVDALTVDASAEPTAVPAANAPVSEKLAWLYALGRNRVLQTSSAQTLRNDANSADIASANVSDDGTTFERGEWT